MAQFLTNPSPPAVLYKFRGDNKRDTKCLLVDRALYLASPPRLNDPFDCFPVIAQPSVEDYDRSIASELDSLPPGHSEADIRRRWHLILNSELHRRRFAEEFYEKDLGRTGVLSLSAVRDDPLLWAHYASNGTGFAVGYRGRDSGDLEAIGVVPVFYKAQRPQLNVFDEKANWLEILHTKSEHWSYEKEWRYVRVDELGGPGLMTVPPKSIVEVCLGPKMAADDRTAVIAAARSLPDRPRIFEVKLNSNSYALDFVEFGVF